MSQQWTSSQKDLGEFWNEWNYAKNKNFQQKKKKKNTVQKIAEKKILPKKIF